MCVCVVMYMSVCVNVHECVSVWVCVCVVMHQCLHMLTSKHGDVKNIIHSILTDFTSSVFQLSIHG